MKQVLSNFFSFSFLSTVTMAGFRRLLELDLELDKDTLFPFKKFITEQVEKVSKTCSGELNLFR